ncbi:MAG: VanZ family protein [Burkholderiaceae bacterium]|nr:VanZ family protein [Burkholderiaceae bacterium]
MSPRALRICAVAAVVAILMLALWPTSESMPLHTAWDKADHVAAFAVLTILGLRAWPSWPLRVVSSLLFYGVLIEVLQSFTSWRHGDWRDVVADVVGVAVGILLLRAWERRRRERLRAQEAAERVGEV